MSSKCVNTVYPISFEALGQGYGFVLYWTDLGGYDFNNKVLSIPGIRDRGFIQIGNLSVGVIYRLNPTNVTIQIPKTINQRLYIIVENMGRLNYGNDMLDSKGILSNVTLDGKVLKNWQTCITDNFIPNYRNKLRDSTFVDFVSRYAVSENNLKNKISKQNIDFSVPAIYIGDFNAADDDYDTFLKMDKFNKGVALIQSRKTLTNLGRYWPHVGPQVTLFTPSIFVTKSAKNYIVLIEFENAASCSNDESCYVEFIDYPILDSIKSR